MDINRLRLLELEEVSNKAISNVGQIIAEIMHQLSVNDALYNQFLSTESILAIIKEFTKRYRSHSQSVEMITMLVDFLSFCKNCHSSVPSLQSNFSLNYAQQLAIRWKKIREPSYFFNKGQLRLLNYFVTTPVSGQQQYGHCFQSLNFDMSIDEARMVAAAVKKMCNEDIRAFSYLSNYLYNCCIKLDKENIPIPQIEAKYIQLLQLLCIENPPAPRLKFNQGELEAHQSIRFDGLIPKIELNLSKFQTEVDKQFGLQAFIMNRAEESLKQLDRFNSIIRKICQINNGFHFKSGVKIKNRQQSKALIRIKEKMLGSIYQQTQIKQKLSSSLKDEKLSKFIDIYSYTSQEYVEYQKKMKKIFSQVKSAIQFKVSDMLRGKCAFASVQKINKCCQAIKDEIKRRQGEGLRLIEIDNRLYKGNGDLVMKILFGNTVAELQLVKDHNTAENEFNHKLYQLKRSKFFTPLTQLAILNQEISKDYFTEMRAIIINNVGTNDYKQKITFEQPLRAFKNFAQKLEVKINFLETHPNQADCMMMIEQQKKLKALTQAKIDYEAYQQKWVDSYSSVLHSGIYHYVMQENSKAAKQLGQAKRMFERVQAFLIKKVQKGIQLDKQEEKKLQFYLGCLEVNGRNNSIIENYQQARACYLLKETLLQKSKKSTKIKIANILHQKGLTYMYEDKNNMAYECLLKSSTIIDHQISGAKIIENTPQYFTIPQTIDNYQGTMIAFLLSLEGAMHMCSDQYENALEKYLKEFDLLQKLNGNGSINTADSLNNIGVTYMYQKNYDMALKYFIKCLQIQQKFDINNRSIAITLKNIGETYLNKGLHDLAIQFYLKCLYIYLNNNEKQDLNLTLLIIKNDHEGNTMMTSSICHQLIWLQAKIKQKFSLSISINRIGKLLESQGHFQAALILYKKSIPIYEKFGSMNEYQAILDHIKAIQAKIQVQQISNKK